MCILFIDRQTDNDDLGQRQHKTYIVYINVYQCMKSDMHRLIRKHTKDITSTVCEYTLEQECKISFEQLAEGETEV